MKHRFFKNQSNSFEVSVNTICVKKYNDKTGELISKILFSDYADAKKDFNLKRIQK